MGTFTTRHRSALLVILSYALLTGAAIFYLRQPPGEPLQLVEPVEQVSGQPSQSNAQAPTNTEIISQTLTKVVGEPGATSDHSHARAHKTESQSATTQSPSNSPTAKININQATAQDLQQLSHIGPTLANRIIAYRKAHGPFRTTDDLVQVKGIGPVMLSRIRDLITVQ